MKSVAIVGEFASGKTTLADVLVQKHGYTRVGFATRLKEMATSIYGGGMPVKKNDEYAMTDPVTGELKWVAGRTLLQELGQSVKSMDRDLWVRWLLADLDSGRYDEGPFVIDDCRFPFEADALREQGFVIVRLVTPVEVRMERYEATYGVRPTQEQMSHPSETEVRNIKADAIFDGTDSVRDLTTGLLAVLREEDDL